MRTLQITFADAEAACIEGEIAAGRAQAARHIIFDRVDDDEMVVLRVLHDAMNPRRYRFGD